jgi:hypothetical protein
MLLKASVSMVLWPLVAAGCSGPSTPSGGGASQDASTDVANDASTEVAHDAAGDSAEDAPGAADAPPAASDASDAASCQSFDLDGGTCNSLPLTGPMVTDTCMSGEPPQPQGGHVDEGVYILQATTWYGRCQPTTTQTTWNVCGGRWDVAQNDITDGGVTGTLHIGFAASVGATSVTLTPGCVESNSFIVPQTRGYTASPGHLMFITEYPSALNPGTLVGEYVKSQ